MKRMIDDGSNTHMNIYILQFINYLHQFLRAVEAIVPLFVRRNFSSKSNFHLFIFSFLF
jgi:hypothetical protein